MDDLQSKIGSIMENPELMQQIMSLAQSLGGNETVQQAPPDAPQIDLQTLQKLSGLAGQNNIDKNQKNLLSALSPYVSHHRLSKLEKAMRAAKMARLASSFLGR